MRITVDMTPASLWVMELSGRVFGFSSRSLLMPQALEGVAVVGVLHATIRRWFGPAAALIAGTVAALTPVATLMFRFDNPDALLALFAKLRPVADTARATYRSDWAGTAPGQQITLNFDIKLIVASSPAERALDLGELTTAIEDFNSIFIRLPSVRRFSFSTLSALHTLSRRGPLRLTDLTATEQLKQPALTALVAKLERDGLVKRRRDPRDGRAVLLSLTPEGQEIVRSRHADRMEGLSRLADGLNDQERDALTGYARVLGRLTEIAAAGDGRGTQGDQRRVHADTSVPPRPGAGPRARRRA